MDPIFVRKTQGDPVCTFLFMHISMSTQDMQRQMETKITAMDSSYLDAGLVTAQEVIIAVEVRIAAHIEFKCVEHMRTADNSFRRGRDSVVES